jgi:uncharacterized membrane protein YfcA
MPLIDAIGSSLLSVGTFGLTTAVNYAASGLVAWPIALDYIAGGVAGGRLGERLARLLGDRKAALTYLYAAVIGLAGIYMLVKSAAVL